MNGFVSVKGGKNYLVNENGIITSRHDQTEMQVELFKEWLKKSLQMTGKLPKNDTDVNQIKVFEKATKTSKVMEMLANLPSLENAEKQVKERPPHRPITPVQAQEILSSVNSSTIYPILVKDQRFEMKQAAKVKPIQLSKLEVKLRKSPRDSAI